ncbi:MAG: recombinase family protein [Lachnospiraceae bacterium]|nr:recombinase family protein [Lachnospiraceae bacterium]
MSIGSRSSPVKRFFPVLPTQKDRLIKFAEFQKMDIVREYCDAGKSGKNISGRPEFSQTLRDIADDRDGVDYILVFKLSRFGRNAADEQWKEFLRDFIESVEIYPEKMDNGRMLKQMNFNSPVYYDGEVGKEIRLLNEHTVETVAQLLRKDQKATAKCYGENRNSMNG